MNNEMVRKKTLLLGNGINQSFDELSWQQLIAEMAGDENFRSDLPMPLQVVLATHNHVDDALKEVSSRMRGNVSDVRHREILRKILEGGFEDIITTNYSYDLEIASSDKNVITNYALNNMRNTTIPGGKVETKYLIHTYNQVTYKDSESRIWHIHGEARNPSSMVIGQYYYANLVARLKTYSDNQKNIYKRMNDISGKYRKKSWIDAFILDDVFILGFGFDLSEIDLWWLLERKNREKAPHGNVYYYCPAWEADRGEKHKLLESYGVKICGVDIKVYYRDYLEFYKQAISQISLCNQWIRQ